MDMKGLQGAGMRRRMTSGTAAALALLAQAALAQGTVSAGSQASRVMVVTKDSAARINRLVVMGSTPAIDSLIKRLDGLPVGSDEFATTNAALQAAINELPHPTGGMFHLELSAPRSAVRLPMDVVPQGTLGFTADGVNRPLYGPAGMYLEYFEYPTIVAIEPNSPASRAGVRAGDLLLAYNGEDVRASAVNMTRLLTPGRQISVRLRRNGDIRDLSMVVDKAPAGLVAERRADVARVAMEVEERRAVENRAQALASARVKRREPDQSVVVLGRPLIAAASAGYAGVLGAAMTDLDPDLAAALRGADGKRGVLVTKVPSGSLADRTGLRGGDVILRVGSADVPTVAQFRLRIMLAEQGDVDEIPLTILRGGKTRELTYRTRDR